MGDTVFEHMKDEAYSIAFTAYQGKAGCAGASARIQLYDYGLERTFRCDDLYGHHGAEHPAGEYQHS
ncbi:MAG: hypothetical protein JXB23_11890 [Candidatus Aminicenantes bacterium]|nr:hypothetical protein [Candidatus Aminicenantes bacterium]